MMPISQKDKLRLFDFLLEYSNTIEHNYSRYNWNDQRLIEFCHANSIDRKINKNSRQTDNCFWFETKGRNGINDIAHHFMRHIRNAIAHGNIEYVFKKGGNSFFIFKDFNKHGTQTMYGKIRTDLFWNYISVIQSTFKR